MFELMTGAVVLTSWILGGMVRSGLHERNQVLMAWREAAERLGLRLSQSGRTIQGTLDGHKFQVRVRSHSEMRQGRQVLVSETRYRLRFERNLPVDLRMRRENRFDTMSRWVGIRDIELGDPRFDQLVRVEGPPTRRLQDLLDATRRLHVASFFEAHETGRIDRQTIEVKHPYYERSAEQIVETVEAMRRLAASLTGVTETPDSHPDPRTAADASAEPLERSNTGQEEVAAPEGAGSGSNEETSDPERDRRTDDEDRATKATARLPDWMARHGVSLEADEGDDGVSPGSHL